MFSRCILIIYFKKWVACSREVQQKSHYAAYVLTYRQNGFAGCYFSFWNYTQTLCCRLLPFRVPSERQTKEPFKLVDLSNFLWVILISNTFLKLIFICWLVISLQYYRPWGVYPQGWLKAKRANEEWRLPGPGAGYGLSVGCQIQTAQYRPDVWSTHSCGQPATAVWRNTPWPYLHSTRGVNFQILMIFLM